MKNTDDKLAIRELIENWAVWRDSLQWDRFRTVWHPEGRMWATWFQGTYEEFIDANLKGCLLYTSPSPRDGLLSRMPSSA